MCHTARIFSFTNFNSACWVIFHNFFSSADFFFKINFFETNSLDPDQVQQKVRPDLGPNCMQRSSADDKISSLQAKS